MTREIKNILCPVDLSPESEAALRNAVTFAQSFHARLFVCHCVSEISSTADAERTRQLNEFVKETIDYFVAGEAQAAGIEWHSIVVENETAAPGIIEAAHSRQADLIIMNSTHHPWLHKLLGSVAEDVCRSAPCPVLIVQPTKAGNAKTSLKRILAAHDFSDYSELALQNAAVLAEKFDAELHLLHVIPEETRPEPAFSWSGRENSFYHLTIERLRKAPFMEGRNVPNLVIAVRWGKPYREILAYAKEQQIDLIAAGAHGADFGSKTLFGSNVERVLRQAPCAILVAHPYKPIFATSDEVTESFRVSFN